MSNNDSKYEVNEAIRKLIAAGVKFSAGKLIEVRESSVGLKRWAMVDFLCNHHDYTFRVVKKSA